MLESAIIDTPIGHFELIEKEGRLVYCNPTKKNITKSIPSLLLQKTIDQLNEYFKGKRKQFKLPLDPQGTPFQQTVWQALTTIPFGETWSYQKLAKSIKKPRAYRAVGSANSKNPISIIIPCHRVIRASGDLGGYASGLDKKTQLLRLENAY